jgi:multimeric flavodoxin WrbA
MEGKHERRQEMKAVILDGAMANDRAGQRVHATMVELLQAGGWETTAFTLREQKIGNCAGDFFCWIRTPGMCNINDDNRTIAAAIAACDLLVYLTPVTFGGYSATLKSMVDHQIQNVSPFFLQIDGETHHRTRYQKNADLLVVGWMDEPDARIAAVFHHLVQRNAINFHARTAVCGVLSAKEKESDTAALVQPWLADVQRGQSSPPVALPLDGAASTAPGTIRRALLLVGSPKTRKSSSNSLGSYLYEQLGTRAVTTETIYLHTVVRNAQKFEALLAAVDTADLVTLAFPLYVDALPAPVTEALERIAAQRQAQAPSRQPWFAAIANCGFPEAHHCDTALAICAAFARQAGLAWAGALALGGGQMLNGVPLAEGGGQTLRIRRSLEMAAAALASGEAIPPEAQALMSRPVIPHWAYRLLGGLGWLQGARGYGALRQLWRKPYLARAR